MPKFADFTDQNAPHQLRFEAYGVTVTVCANSEELLARAEAFMPPGARALPPRARTNGYELGIITAEQGSVLAIIAEEDGGYSIYNRTVRISEGQSLDLSLVILEGQVRGHVALHAPDRTFVHAGVVAHDGKAIVVPGYSFAGKTTLVAALVRLGAVYYSDEFAVLDDRGLLHPYAKPLSLRGADRQQVDQTVESLGGVAGHDPVRIGLAAVTHYEPGAHWSPKRLSPGESALALLSHTVTAQTRPDAALKAVRNAMDGTVALEGKRGEAEETAHLLLAALTAEG